MPTHFKDLLGKIAAGGQDARRLPQGLYDNPPNPESQADEKQVDVEDDDKEEKLASAGKDLGDDNGEADLEPVSTGSDIKSSSGSETDDEGTPVAADLMDKGNAPGISVTRLVETHTTPSWVKRKAVNLESPDREAEHLDGRQRQNDGSSNAGLTTPRTSKGARTWNLTSRKRPSEQQSRSPALALDGGAASAFANAATELRYATEECRTGYKIAA